MPAVCTFHALDQEGRDIFFQVEKSIVDSWRQSEFNAYYRYIVSKVNVGRYGGQEG